jgi:hypothetical protein
LLTELRPVDSARATGFRTVRLADARWVENAFFEARAAASGPRPNLRVALDLLAIARPALQESPAMLLALAHTQRGYDDLASYDGVLAMVPRHHEALLGGPSRWLPRTSRIFARGQARASACASAVCTDSGSMFRTDEP